MRLSDVAEIPTSTEFMTKEHSHIQNTARQYAKNEVEPVARDFDSKGFQGELMPEEIMYDKPAELGFHGMLLSEKYGGMEIDPLSYAIIVEEISRAWMSASTVIVKSQGIPGATEDQKKKYYPKMVNGECLQATALSEPNGGSDAANMNTTAEKEGSVYVINGQKMWLTHGKQADVIILYASTDPDAQPNYKGISAFIIDKKPGEWNLDGLKATRIPVLGSHGINTWEVSFSDFEVPEEKLVGEKEGKGFKQIMQKFEIERIRIAAQAIGCARAALEDSIIYANERNQFGSPIKEYQGVRFKLAEMATNIQAARSLTHEVAAKMENPGRYDLEAGMAKLFASEMAMDVCREGIQIHGGNGYSMEYPLQRYHRDAQLLTIGEGTTNIQKKIISDRIYND